MSKRDQPIGEGATTLDMLYANYPWLKERMELTEKLLGDLTDHIDSARHDENAEKVFCKGCDIAFEAAKKWLDANDPKWQDRRVFRFPSGTRGITGGQ